MDKYLTKELLLNKQLSFPKLDCANQVKKFHMKIVSFKVTGRRGVVLNKPLVQYLHYELIPTSISIYSLFFV